VEHLIGIIIIVFGILFGYIAYNKHKKDEWKYPQKYSYIKTILIFLITNLLSIIICTVIFIFSKSLEIAISISVIIFFYLLSGLIRELLVQKRIKDRL